MTPVKDSLIYLKIFLLIILIGTLYWRDFFAMWQVAISTGWLVFTLIIVCLSCVFVAQRRKPLKTLLLMSENNNSRGAAFIALALVLYFIGSYTQYVPWLHLCSLILFTTGYLMLVADFRIPRILLLPLISLLFAIPPLGNEIFEVPIIPTLFTLYLGVNAVIIVLAGYVINSSKFWKIKTTNSSKKTVNSNGETEAEKCPLCQSDTFKEEVFCFHCGRQRLRLQLKPFKSALAKSSVLLLIVLVLSLVYVPTFSLVERDPLLMYYSPHGSWESARALDALIPTPEGWKLESSERLVDYEKEYLEDFAAVATYTQEKLPENKWHIQLEISSVSPYMRDNWQNTSSLSGWQRDIQKFALTETARGRYVILTNSTRNESIVVLYWIMGLTFTSGSDFSTKNVGVSIFSNFTEQITETKSNEILADLKLAGVSIIDRWDYVSLWTRHTLTLNGIYNGFKDIFFTIAGVAAALVFAGWVRIKDEKTDKHVEDAFILLENEADLSIAISTIPKRRFLGKELLNIYKNIVKAEVDFKDFYEGITTFSMLGLLKKDYLLKNGELLMVWKKILL